MTIQDDHKLVTTGPYSIVRHPAYIAAFMFYIGSVLSLFGPGSYWKEAGLWRYAIGMTAGGFYILYTMYIGLALFGRVAKEDEVLRKEFKEQWLRWAKKTP